MCSTTAIIYAVTLLMGIFFYVRVAVLAFSTAVMYKGRYYCFSSNYLDDISIYYKISNCKRKRFYQKKFFFIEYIYLE